MLSRYINIVYFQISENIWIVFCRAKGCFSDAKGTQNPTNIPPNVPYENCSHFWETFRFWGGRAFSIFGVEDYL